MSGLTLTAHASAGRRARSPVAGLLVVALGGLAVVVAWAQLRGADALVGYGMPAPPTPWLLGAVPALRLVVTLAGGACLGLLVTTTGRTDDRVLGRVGLLAALWTGAALLGAVALVVAALGRGGVAALGQPVSLLGSMVTFGEPAAMLVAAVAGAVLTVVVGLGVRVRAGLVALAALGVLAPAVTGPTTRTGTGHDLVSDAAVFAVLGAGIWLGVTLLGAIDGAAEPGTGCMQRRIAVTAGAVTTAATVLGTVVLVQGEWTSPHARWAVLQVVLLAAALLLVLRRARPGAVAAVLLAAATAGALAAIEPPPARLLPATMQQMMVGFDVPAAPSVAGLFLPGRPDLLWAVVGGTLAVGYLLLVRRVDGWPRARLVCWLAGCALLVGVTSSTLGSLSMAVFSAHAAVHVVLSTLVPVLLAAGGPLTLLARVLPDGGARVRVVVDGPVLRVLTHPLVALTVFAGSMFALYLTPLFPAVLPSHWAHQLLAAVVLASGYLFLWPIVGVDRAPRPLPHVARLALLLASMPFHAAFAITLLGVTEAIGATYYERLEVTWVPDLLADQRLGALVGWGAAEGALLVILLAVLARWAREDRPSDTDGGEVAPQDALLAELARRRGRLRPIQ